MIQYNVKSHLPEVSFEIQPNEAIRQNLRFWLNLKRNLSVLRSASICTNCDVVTSVAQESIYIQLSYALITAVFIYFVLLVTTRLIQGKPKHVLEHKQKTETILEAKRNEIREQKRREGTFKTQTIYNLDGER